MQKHRSSRRHQLGEKKNNTIFISFWLACSFCHFMNIEIFYVILALFLFIYFLIYVFVIPESYCKSFVLCSHVESVKFKFFMAV